jgi:hypothetical protein
MTAAATLIPTTRALPTRFGRAVEFPAMVDILRTQDWHKLDIVVPLSNVVFHQGLLIVAGVDPVLCEDGVVEVSGAYRLTDHALQQLASLKEVDIPIRYLRRMRDGDAGDVGLFDTTVNHWTAKGERKVLLRLIWGEDPKFPGTIGICRAVLSDRYGIRDNYDTVLAILAGMKAAGLDPASVNMRPGDLSDDRLYLRVEAPGLSVIADKFLENYVGPYANRHGGELGMHPKVVWAGFLAQNSEVGRGKTKITPEIRIGICDNGAQITYDAVEKVHVGGQLDEGQIVWSHQTREAANALTQSMVKDAVERFLSVEYVQATIDKLEEKSGTTVSDIPKTVEVVAKQLSYTDVEAKGLLDHFIRGGQHTSGGIFQAVTSWAQEIQDPDRSNEFAATGLQAMDIAHEANFMKVPA